MDKNVGDLEYIQSVKTCTNCPQRLSFRTAEWRTSRSNQLAEVHLKMAAEKSIHHHHTTTALSVFSGPPGWAGARRELLDFMVQGKINRGRHTDHPAGCHSIRTNQCPSPLKACVCKNGVYGQNW